MFAAFMALPAIGHPENTNASCWRFKQDFLTALVQAVPKLLSSQNTTNGRFGEGLWIPNDQNVIYPLAAAWAVQARENPYYHDHQVLEAVMRGGDALVEAQDKDGRWVFLKKDGSTWGRHYDPWVYSRWARVYSLIRDAMPPERRARWQKALELGYAGIQQHELGHIHNIPAHHAMGLYVAGKALNHPEWCDQASAFLVRVAGKQDTNGFWSEHLGPVVNYNTVYFDALGTYYGITHDTKVLAALERCARFHANFTYPDGSDIETVDERNPYSKSCRLPNVGASFSAEGRGYLREQWTRLEARHAAENADTLASLLLYGEEGPASPSPGTGDDATFVTGDGKAAVLRQEPWCACLSAYAAPISRSRWIQDRQNLLSLFHQRTGLILGGGNTKLQPLWSTFTVGDTTLLKHRPGDEAPDFSEPAGLLHVPSQATLAANGPRLTLEYGETRCSVALDFVDRNRTRLTYAVSSPLRTSPVEAHVPFLPAIGKRWRTASGKSGSLGTAPFQLSAAETGPWFEHNGWRVDVPPEARITWPVLPHNPYRKDGQAGPGEGRIVLTLPFSTNVTTQTIMVKVAD